MKKLLLGLVLLSGVIALYGDTVNLDGSAECQESEGLGIYWYTQKNKFDKPVLLESEEYKKNYALTNCTLPCNLIRARNNSYAKSNELSVKLYFKEDDPDTALGCKCMFMFKLNKSKNQMCPE